MTYPDTPAPLTARILDAAIARGDQTAISSFGRSWSYTDLTARAGRMTGALARLDVGPDKRLGLMLPPVPTAAMTALAGLRLGATLVPCDPLSRGEALADRLSMVASGVLVSLDLTRLQHRWLELLDDSTLDAVLVDKMAELLPFPRNLLAPLLRGGELATLPRHPRTSALPDLLKAETERPAALDASAQAGVLRADGSHADARALSEAIERLLELVGGAGRWLIAQHPEDAWATAALLAPLTAGREVVLLPRLDARTVATALDQAAPRVAVISPKVAETLADSPPPKAQLDLAVVPPTVDATLQDRLSQAVGARVAVWEGP
ncbi:AMP-binding protein [Rhodovibrio salinarum]|uniref:AMP-binding protein n=1 Tax=Rhodovibrio salinarum TaxID=1087 RepID=UPI00047FC453|nr:AMP-binding protein [Rhodovibrio salinarum]